MPTATATATSRPFRTWNRDRVALVVAQCEEEMFEMILAGGTPTESLEWGFLKASMELQYRRAEELARRAARPACR